MRPGPVPPKAILGTRPPRSALTTIQVGALTTGGSVLWIAASKSSSLIMLEGECDLARPTRHRQNPFGDRTRDPRLPSRASSAVRHRQPVGPTSSPTPTPLDGYKQNWLAVDEVGYILRTRSSQPVLPTRLQPLRTRQLDRNLQQAIRPLGRSLGDEVVAAAMIDRLVHHAEVVSLRGDSYRLKDRDLGRTSTTNNEDQ